VRFIGRAQSGECLDSIDILVVPSVWNELFGRASVEAYSHGVPVVGANTGGIPEVIEPHSNLAFHMDRPETLIMRLHQAVAMLAYPSVHERMREHARRFTPESMVAAYLDLYQRVLRARPVGENAGALDTAV
jgi:glycosyltransferase involved in cell wall biosynthesis